jgi:hypothetical protein
VHHIVHGANHPLSLAVLWRSIRTRHAQLNDPSEKQRAGGVVIELTPVVTLDSLGKAELSGHPGKEVQDGGKRLRLGAQRKSPRVMREIINHHEIEFTTKNAEYRRCPQITVNKIKGMRLRLGAQRKRKSNMTT